MYLIKPSYEILNFDCDINLIERAARTCYKSEPKGDAAKFVEKICRNNHLSTIEHSLITVKIIADRGFLGEITRHRLCSFSVESSRFINYNKKGVSFIIPPWVNIKPGLYQYLEEEESLNSNNADSIAWCNSMLDAEYYYTLLINRKQKPEQARSVLPLALATEMIISANAREWRHIFELRCQKTSHEQMREIMIPLRDEFIRRCPCIFNKEN